MRPVAHEAVDPLRGRPVAPLALRGGDKENLPEALLRCVEEMRDGAGAGHQRLGPRKGLSPLGVRQKVLGVSVALKELEEILIYVECVTASLLKGARAPKPPDHLQMVQSSVITPSRVTTECKSEGTSPYPIASSLHAASDYLLSWYLKLQYVSFPSSVTLQGLELSLTSAFDDARAALDSMERRYKYHEMGDVREFYLGSRQTIDACHRIIGVVLESARELLALRQTVAARELAQTQKLFNALKQQKQQQGQDGASSVFSAAHQNCPFLVWLEAKWIPAMTMWERILSTARKETLSSEVGSAMTRAKADVLWHSGVLSEILLPRESLTDFIRENLEATLTKIAEPVKHKSTHLDALRTAMSLGCIKDISECVCALDELVKKGELSESECELHKEGKERIIQLQQVENMEGFLRLTAQAGEIVSLFRTIHQANVLMLQLGIVGDVAATEAIVTRCAALLEEMESTKCMSPNSFIACRVSAASMSLAHLPSVIWTANMSSAYQAACQRFTSRVAQELSRLGMERVLDTRSEDAHHLNKTLSSRGDVMSVASNTTGSVGGVHNVRMNRSFSSAMQYGEAHLRSAEVLKIKVHFEAQLRVVRLTDPEQVNFELIYNKLHALCTEQTMIRPSPGQRLRIRYQDNDGDCISLMTEQDWNAYVDEFAPGGLRNAKLDLYCDFQTLPQSRDTEVPLTLTPPSSAPSSALRPDRPAGKAEEAVIELPRHLRPAVEKYDLSREARNHSISLLTANAIKTEAAAVTMTVKNLAEKRLAESFQIRHLPACSPTALRARAEVPNYMRISRSRSAVLGSHARSVSHPRIVTQDDSVLHARGETAESVASLTATSSAATHKSQPKGRTKAAVAVAQSPVRVRARIHASPVTRSPSRARANATAHVSGGGVVEGARRQLIPAQCSAPRAQPVRPSAVPACSRAPHGIKPQRDKQPHSPANSLTEVNLRVAKKWTDGGDTYTAATGKIDREETSPVPTVDNGAPVHDQSPGKGRAVNEKREWNMDAYRLSDIRSVVSEATVLPASEIGGGQQTTTTTAGKTHVRSVGSANSAADVKKKIGVLRELKQLRDENQKALNAALYHRRMTTT